MKKTEKYNFIKPDWRKIIIFIILSFFGVLMRYMMIGMACIPGRNILSFISYENISILLFPFDLIYFLFFSSNGIFCFSELSNLYYLLIFHLIYWYFLSCLIVWIYDKMKK